MLVGRSELGEYASSVKISSERSEPLLSTWLSVALSCPIPTHSPLTEYSPNGQPHSTATSIAFSHDERKADELIVHISIWFSESTQENQAFVKTYS